MLDRPPARREKRVPITMSSIQIGLGVSMLLSLMWSDSIGVALVGFIVAGAIHSINHALDRHLGRERAPALRRPRGRTRAVRGLAGGIFIACGSYSDFRGARSCKPRPGAQ